MLIILILLGFMLMALGCVAQETHKSYKSSALESP